VKSITPAKSTNAGTRSLVRSLGLKLSRVVIDAGHGGHDTGTVGQNGFTEKELVLDVAQRLKLLVENELGSEVVMTRSDDSFVPLETRTALANDQQADLFISIHANSSRVRSVRGVETYYLNFTSSREALETASRENAASERSIHELQDLVKKIMLQDKVDESRELAQHVGKALAARKGAGLDRGVKQAPFVVLIGANMPSVLAEICFISNPQDEKQLRNPDNRQAIAESLYEGVRSYAESLSGTKTAKTQEKTN
jgi:N-acetylmuramoyl-L-alanine amidase